MSDGNFVGTHLAEKILPLHRLVGAIELELKRALELPFRTRNGSLDKETAIVQVLGQFGCEGTREVANLSTLDVQDANRIAWEQLDDAAEDVSAILTIIGIVWLSSDHHHLPDGRVAIVVSDPHNIPMHNPI